MLGREATGELNDTGIINPFQKYRFLTAVFNFKEGLLLIPSNL